ncbi:7205_t:CDS:10, partial [Diversispora eburnea]
MNFIRDIFSENATPVTNVETPNPRGSFSPVREGIYVKWYVDGKNYFHAVSEALLAAQHEIYIEDWWLSPELYLRRPPSKNERFRLDRILKEKAEQNVKIYVVLYKEVPQVLTLNSEHSQTHLEALHENIHVLRHPDHGIDGTLFWAHHEKMIVIDRHLAFIGGLDLCFGRYDTGKHQVSDYSETSHKISVWPGQDYSNPRIKDFVDVKNWSSALIDKKMTARMPWHDVSIGLIGKAARDVGRHFIQRWNFIKKHKAENKLKYPVLIPKSEAQWERENCEDMKSFTYSGKSLQIHPSRGPCNVQILRSSASWSLGLAETEHSIKNAYIETITNAKHFIYIENQFFITATKESDDYPIKNLIGKAIVERVIKAYKNKENFRLFVLMPLLPAFPAELETSGAATLRLIIHYQYNSICRGGHSIIEKIKEAICESSGIGKHEEEKLDAIVEKYISFYGLRSHDRIDYLSVDNALGKLMEESNAPNLMEAADSDPALATTIMNLDPSGTFVTEELYIHTKLLIADDRIVIIGSGFNGDHDSEIAAIIEDREFIDSSFPGGKVKHLGIEFESDHESGTHPPPIGITGPYYHCENDKFVENPVSDQFFELWTNTAKTNTEIYSEIFACVPDDKVTDWDEYKNFVPDHAKIPIGHICESARGNLSATEAKLKGIKARVIEPHSNAVLCVREHHVIQWDASSNPKITDIISANLYKGFGSDVQLIQTIPINRKASIGCSEPFIVPDTSR